MVTRNTLILQPEGIPFSRYLSDLKDQTRWKAYIQSLSDDKVPLDPILLLAVANVCNVKIVVMTSGGNKHTIHPYPPQVPVTELILGHVQGKEFVKFHKGNFCLL